MNWPADKIEYRAPSDLVPYARNARTHSDAQVAQIASSIKEWGWTMPVLIDQDGGVIAGHGRILAARCLGVSEIPVMVASGWSDAQKKAYAIADNKLALNAGWDEDLLRIELEDVASLGFDIRLIGFTDDEIAALSPGDGSGLTDPDEVPEPPVIPVSKLGETWILGAHRLRCGDSTSEADVAKLLDGVRPHLMVTDPPYGVDYEPVWRNEVRTPSKRIGVVRNDDRADWREVWALFPGDVAYVWHAGIHGQTVADSMISCGFFVRSQIIWVKNRFAISRGHYHWQHEPCFYAVRERGKSMWQGSRDQSTVWQIAIKGDGDDATSHGTQKPVECMRRPILNNSSPGQAVYEPFSGSGTTIIAGEMEGRSVYAMEIDPIYCDVCINRWQAFTGEPAIRDDGAHFAEAC